MRKSILIVLVAMSLAVLSDTAAAGCHRGAGLRARFQAIRLLASARPGLTSAQSAAGCSTCSTPTFGTTAVMSASSPVPTQQSSGVICVNGVCPTR